MTKRRFTTSALLLATLAVSTASYAADIEVKSENVIFVGDVSEAEGKQLVKNLEIYRETIIALVGLKGKPDKKPLRVYGIKTNGELKKYTNMRGIAGVYKQGLQGPIFVTITKGGFDNGRWASQVALHEYGHHILNGMSREDFPRWYDEGFANYLSSFKIEGEIITVGAPNVTHGRSLKENKWMNPETVFSSIKYYPTKGNITQFYGQSWLYVHYMQNTPELGKQLPIYMAKLKAGEKPIPAFESAYGMTVREFHNKARDYWGENAFPVMQFKGSEKLLNPDVSVRQLSESEAQLAYAEGERNFMSKKKAKTLKKTYDELAETIGQTPKVLLGQAHSALFLENYESAATYVENALKQVPDDVDTLSLRGDIFYHSLLDGMVETLPKGAIRNLPDNTETKQVISYFEEALTNDPYDYTAVTHLVALYGRSSIPLNPIARKAVRSMAQSYLNTNSAGQNMDLANIYMREGDSLTSCAFFSVAKRRVAEYKDKKVNDDFARVEAFDKEHTQCF
jgi:tetratricopeptide (TPR) repeat protein